MHKLEPEDAMKRSRTLFEIISYLPEVVVGLLVLGMVILANSEVLFRYFLGIQVGGVDELLKMMLVWLTFSGAALAAKRGAHFSVQVLVKRVPKYIQKILRCLGETSVAVFGFIMVVEGIGATEIAFRQVFTGLKISYGWQYIVVPIGGTMICAYGLRSLVQIFKKKLN